MTLLVLVFESERSLGMCGVWDYDQFFSKTTAYACVAIFCRQCVKTFSGVLAVREARLETMWLHAIYCVIGVPVLAENRGHGGEPSGYSGLFFKALKS